MSLSIYSTKIVRCIWAKRCGSCFWSLLEVWAQRDNIHQPLATQSIFVSICPECHFSQRGWRVRGLNHNSHCTSFRKHNQTPVTYQRAFKKPFSAALPLLSETFSHGIHSVELCLQTFLLFTRCYQSRPMHCHLSGYPGVFLTLIALEWSLWLTVV